MILSLAFTLLCEFLRFMLKDPYMIFLGAVLGTFGNNFLHVFFIKPDLAPIDAHIQEVFLFTFFMKLYSFRSGQGIMLHQIFKFDIRP